MSPSFWPAGSNGILGKDVIFWSRRYLTNRVPRAIIIRLSHRRITDTIVSRVGEGAGVLKSWDTLSLKTSQENERRCLEFGWQKHSVVLKLDESDRMWAHLIRSRLNIFLQWRRGGEEEEVRADPSCTFSTGVTKVWDAAAPPNSWITPNTPGDGGCQLASKTLGADGCRALSVYLPTRKLHIRCTGVGGRPLFILSY